MPKKLANILGKKATNAIKSNVKAPLLPARTRFAPSPTGLIHLGSARTAVYNYLWARATGGQFLLRLEDTDQKRLVSSAESNIYRSLEWLGLNWDEGPLVGGDFGPYRQSERKDIYKNFIETLVAKGDAYRCFCPKERLKSLAESARQLHPPSTASYDRKCYHLSAEESEERAHAGEEHVVRFKSPSEYPEFVDELHGPLTINPQVNQADVRFDDYVLFKSDGLPTYHFANVVDDHLMKINYVIRGEEWLPSTPKHIALYRSFDWTPPHFVHIPLLVGAGGKKLSKRKSDEGILEYAPELLPESFLNFVALLGWSPGTQNIAKKSSEVMDVAELVNRFNIDGLTKGNVHVDMSKLWHFDAAHFKHRLASDSWGPIPQMCHAAINKARPELNISLEKTTQALEVLKKHVTGVRDFLERASAVYGQVEHSPRELDHTDVEILTQVSTALNQRASNLNTEEAKMVISVNNDKKKVFEVLRYALLNSVPGASVLEVLVLLDPAESARRINQALTKATLND